MNPILIDLPMPITTPRLVLRPPTPGDGAELNAAIKDSLEELKSWMPWAQIMPTPEESEANVRKAYAQWILREDLRISIFDRATGKLAGSSGLHRINWELPSFEMGYWIRTSFVGRGYATEAANAITRYAFEHLKAKRVELRCDATNTRSLAVFGRLGFEKEGLLRCHDSVERDGLTRPRDTWIYSRLTPDGLPELEVNW